MWKAPYRSKNEITQSYNDGFLTLYSQHDTAEPGRQPKPEFVKEAELRFEERKLGIQRYYSAAQSQQRVERVLRVPRIAINAQDVVKTHDGRMYRVELVQAVPDVFPPSLDLTLSRIEQIAEVES